MRLLAALTANPGEVVSREELQKRLWPDDTFVDFETGLNIAVRKLREALTDCPENPRYVETIPKRGYRFISPIEKIPIIPLASASRSETAMQNDTTTAPIQLAIQDQTRSHSSPNTLAAKYSAVALCIALLGVVLTTKNVWPRKSTQNGHASLLQISKWNKPLNTAKLSPDGHAVAFVSPVNGIGQVFLMLTSGGEPLQLTNDNDEGGKMVDNFSPDGKEIYYGKYFGQEEVWAVPTLGGTPRRVTTAAYGYVVPSPDSKHIFYNKTDRRGIFRAETSGLNEELVYEPEEGTLPFMPLLVFPGGKDLLSASFPNNALTGRIFRIDLVNHQRFDLGTVVDLDEDTGIPDLVWDKPGESILLSRMENGLRNIWRYSLRTRVLAQSTFGTGPDYSPMPDPGGNGLYFVNGKSLGILTAFHTSTKESTDIVSGDASEPIISPNGKRVMYVTESAPSTYDLWSSDINGRNRVRLATGSMVWDGYWAPDNYHVSFLSETQTQTNAYVVGADGNGLRLLPRVEGTPFNVAYGPGLKSIYMSTVEKSESTYVIWKMDLDSFKPVKLSDECGEISDVDPKERYLIGRVLTGAKTGIYEVSIADGKCIQLLPGVGTFNVTFAPDGKSFLYSVASRDEVTIYRQPWEEGNLTGSPSVALKLPFSLPTLHHGGNAYDFSKDLSTVIYSRPGGHADLYLQRPGSILVGTNHK